jgi:hypothetical protein
MDFSYKKSNENLNSFSHNIYISDNYNQNENFNNNNFDFNQINSIIKSKLMENNYNQMIMNSLQSCESDRNLISEKERGKLNKNNKINNNSDIDLSRNVEEIKIKRPNFSKFLEVSKQEDKNLVDSIFYNENKNHENYDKSNSQRSFLQSENAFNKLNVHNQKKMQYHSHSTHFNPHSKFTENSSEESNNHSCSDDKCICFYFNFLPIFIKNLLFEC